MGIDISTYVAAGNASLVAYLEKGMHKGITLTCSGFYGPQGRRLRADSLLGSTFFDQIESFDFEGLKVTNFEMETSGIFGLASLLGHRATSCNAILANRVRGEFSKNPKVAVDKLIDQVLEKI
jgi:uridine phosphorylase